jgi:hypothetical protein
MTKIKKLFVIILAGLFLSGCATYSFRKGESPYDKGFVAARYDRVLPEYTLGKDNSVPDEKIAKERFQRRRKQVESYYKKMGYIENRFKQMFVDPPVFMLQSVIGVFRLPSIAIRDYKYNHDSLYREEIDKKEDAAYKAEKERLKALKDELNSYIQKDLEKNEPLVPSPVEVKAPESKEAEVAPKVKEPVQEAVKEKPVEVKPKVAEAPVAQASSRESEMTEAISKNEIASPAARNDNQMLTTPIAVITAKPLKGLSPLTVQFSAAKSSSPNGRITSYFWDFGDGDSSDKKKTSNTYWSTTYGSRKFRATLTVKDVKGVTSSAVTEIEVITK